MGFGYEVADALDIIRRDNEIYSDFVSQDAINAGNRMAQAMDSVFEDVKESIVGLLKDELSFRNPHASVWWYSVLIEIKKDTDLFMESISYIRKHAENFSENTQYFLFYQLKSLRFRFPELDRPDVCIELWKFYGEIVKRFVEKLSVFLEAIPSDRRDNNKVVVITEQFLSAEHGPTKTAADRCKILMERLKKEVVLINTAEVLSMRGNIPFYGAMHGSYIERQAGQGEREWKGVKIPYVQCENDMPNYKTMKSLLTQIREMSPEHVIAIGGNSILANLVDRMIPVLTVGLSPSLLEMTSTKYQSLGRKLNDADKNLLEEMGIPEKSVIESVFTSSLKPQSEHISRVTLGVSEKDFLMIVVGARLDVEVTEEFLSMLDDAVSDDMHVGFLGIFENFERYLEKFPKIRQHASNFGFADDILSRLEICDLYINPKRVGGGTSCVEAMYKGVPVVTLDYGDVAVNAGKEFCVENYGEMKKAIQRYYTDAEYYKEMSQKAVKRTELLLDSAGEFVRIIEEMDKRESERSNDEPKGENDAGFQPDKVRHSDIENNHKSNEKMPDWTGRY